jgi:hypothetical protein
MNRIHKWVRKTLLKMRIDCLWTAHRNLIYVKFDNEEAQPHINNAKDEIVRAISKLEEQIRNL